MIKKVGLVGLGKLGTAMLTHWDQQRISIGLYHPNRTKAEQIVQHYQTSYLLKEEDLSELDVLILALPAMEVIPFISSLKLQSKTQHSPYIINMATNLHTFDIRHMYSTLNVYGIKYMGHARDLLEHGNGLFISESLLPPIVEEYFKFLGKIVVDSEDCLTQVNKIATYYALKTAINLENEFAKRGLSTEYLKRALTSLAPEVIRSYSEGSLGHFAKEIVNQIQEEK
ncbi:NAD(P)-binding domain-containing protein [Bacillus sp. 1P10SD]|uniref:NAD(P)-binding domain-containing protein n=1 Tax=Bacillus sp. 1P10SD TaxID=3132265 RepID=UPI0039A63B61